MSDADDLEIKKRARRRLVGAVALALLAAVVLPVMMDQEPRPAVQDIQITIPDRDTDAPPRPAAAAAADEAPPSLPPVPEEEAPRPAAPPAEAAKPAEGRKPEAAPAPAAAPKAPEAKAPATADEAEAARVRAILGGKEVPARGESFVLQIGAFGDGAKAAQLAADLKKQGFAAYTEKAGNVTRVRVGPVAGREAGEKLALRLKAAGHDAVLTPR